MRRLLSRYTSTVGISAAGDSTIITLHCAGWSRSGGTDRQESFFATSQNTTEEGLPRMRCGCLACLIP